MSDDQHTNSHVKRIVLPSGREIEVIALDFESELSGPVGLANAKPNEQETEDLHLCPCCDQDLVNPVEWEEVTPGLWEVALWCPNCDWRHTGRFAQRVVDRFDDILDKGLAQIADDLHQLARSNMEDDINCFIAALNADAIWPSDF